MKVTYLKNPWSGEDVKITDEEATERLGACMETFATDAEKYTIEGEHGVDAVNALIDKHGAYRAADIWFS